MEKIKDAITTRNDRSQVLDYNNPLFYCYANKHYYSESNYYSITEHWHEDLEFMYILDGSLEYTINGKNIHLEKGHGILVNSKRIHSNYSPKGSSCTFYCMILHPSYMSASNYIDQKFIAPVTGPNAFDYLILDPKDWTGEILADINRIFEFIHDDTLELKILEECFKIIRLIHQNIDLSKPQNSTTLVHINTFKDMILYIQDHYMEKVALEDIADAGNVGKTLCTKIFKTFVYSTPADYLIKYRITKSLELLKSSGMSITEIAFSTGFTSASHFTKTFREQIGCTPNKYRNSSFLDNEFKFHKVNTI